MENVRLEDVLVVPVATNPNHICGRHLGEVTTEQLMGAIEQLPVGELTISPPEASTALQAIRYEEDEE